MAALDFPASPTNGQKYPNPAITGVPQYTWDGEKWTMSLSAGASGPTDWADITNKPATFPSDWATTAGKPATFPPTTPIAQAGITNLVSDLAAKAPLASPAFSGTPTGITAAHVGLGNVNNTTDAAKPVSTAQQTALNLKADLASPTFTGTPLSTTPATTDSTTKVATTAFVKAQYLENSVNNNPVSLAAGAVDAAVTITVTGAVVGDYCVASFASDLLGVTLLAWVSAANTVKFQFQNKTATTQDLPNAQVKVRVWK